MFPSKHARINAPSKWILLMKHSADTINTAEWVALHTSYEQSERMSLVIKLVAVLLTACLLCMQSSNTLASAFIGILWMQDAIWKTFQSRTEQRLITLEKLNASTPPQFYSDWEKHRPSALKLIKAYLSCAFRPTIAYPYPLLIGLSLLVNTFG